MKLEDFFNITASATVIYPCKNCGAAPRKNGKTYFILHRPYCTKKGITEAIPNEYSEGKEPKK